MSNRRFEMRRYRQIVRMRLGETDRSIARAGLMGGRSQRVRDIAEARGWLTKGTPSRRGRPGRRFPRNPTKAHWFYRLPRTSGTGITGHPGNEVASAARLFPAVTQP